MRIAKMARRKAEKFRLHEPKANQRRRARREKSEITKTYLMESVKLAWVCIRHMMGTGNILETKKAQLPLSNRASPMHFVVGRLLSRSVTETCVTETDAC